MSADVIVLFICGVALGILAWGSGYLRGRDSERDTWEARTMALRDAVVLSTNGDKRVDARTVTLILDSWMGRATEADLREQARKLRDGNG